MNKNTAARKAMENTTDVFPDKVICHAGGTDLTARRGFFYTHGKTAQDWASTVENALKAAGFEVLVLQAREEWNTWPKDSFWSVKIRIINTPTN